MAIPENQLILVFCSGREMAKIKCVTRMDGHHSQLLDNDEYKIIGNGGPLSEMRAIDFGFGCGFEYLPRKFLEKCVAAEEIDIGYRQVEVIHSEDFRGNANLKRLLARVNELTELPPYLFEHTPKIEEIDFTSNNIEKIHPNTFAVGVENLKTLNLTWNKIKALDGRTFAKAVSLESLNLHLNPIEEFRMKFMRQEDVDHVNENKDNNSTDCMIFPFAFKKTLSVELLFNKLKDIEVDCRSDMRCLLRKTGISDQSCITISVGY